MMTNYSYTPVLSYLSPQLNLEKMYTLFKLKSPLDKISYSSYRRIFNYDFKLSFGQPQVDVCGNCEEFKTKLINKMLNDSIKRTVACEQMVHLRRSKKFHAAIKDRMEKNTGVLSICFDYMQNINLPRIPVQESFYKRQLTCSVFCIHDIHANKSRLYVYEETEGKKGPDEVCSFLADFIFNKLENEPNAYHVLHLFSDNCGGQNKNHTVLRFMQALSDNNIFQECRFFFPMRGHSFNDCDRDFGMIKKKLNTYDRIYTVRQVIEIIAQCGINKFEVVRIRHNDIRNFKSWWPRYYRKLAVSEETRDYSRAQRINFQIQGLYQFMTANESPSVMVARPYIDGLVQNSFVLRQPGTIFPICFPTEPAYTNKIKLNTEKLRDLVKDLIKYVPNRYQLYYEHLQ